LRPGRERTQKFGVITSHIRIEHHANANYRGRQMFKEVERFSNGEDLVKKSEASDVSARMGQVCNEALGDGIVDDHKDDRNRAGLLPQR
jgi:hypothetical protein